MTAVINDIAFPQHWKRGSGRRSGSANVRTSSAKVEDSCCCCCCCCTGRLRALTPGLRAATRLLTVAATRTKAKQAAPSPAVQPEKQPAKPDASSRLPLLTGMRKPALSSRQHMQSCRRETTTKQGKGQAPNGKDVRTSLKEAEFEESQQTAALQTAQARKPKAAKRKAAKSQGTTPQTKARRRRQRRLIDSRRLFTECSSGARRQHAAKGTCSGSKRKACHAATHRTQQMLQRPSSHGHPAPRTASGDSPTPCSRAPQRMFRALAAAAALHQTLECAGHACPCPNCPRGGPQMPGQPQSGSAKPHCRHSQSSPATLWAPLCCIPCCPQLFLSLMKSRCEIFIPDLADL